MKKILLTLGISGGLSWLIVGLVLPAIVSLLIPTFNAIGVRSSTYLIVYLGLVLSFLASLAAISYLSENLNFFEFLKFLIFAFLASLVLLMIGCYLYLIAFYPDVYRQDSLFKRMMSIPSAPALLALIESIEPIWLTGSILYYIIIFGGFSNVKIERKE